MVQSVKLKINIRFWCKRMSTTEDKRLLVIGLINKGERLVDSPLLVEAETMATHPQVEWLFFYQENMGIISEGYEQRLITGYPVLNFGKGDQPFNDRISRELFTEFFKRFLFARKVRVIILTTLVGCEIIKKIARKSNIKIVFYQREQMAIQRLRIKGLKNVEVFSTKKTDTELRDNLFPLQYTASLAELIESKLAELNRE